MLADYFEPVQLMDVRTVADGLGGFQTILTPGAEIRAGITTDSSHQAMIAYQQGLKTIYIVVTDENSPLAFGTIIKRLDPKHGGMLLRVTTDAGDMTTPKNAVVKFCQVQAERYVPKR